MTQITLNTDAKITMADIEEQAVRVYGYANFKLSKSNDRVAGCRVVVECTASYTQKNGVIAESWYEDKAMWMAYAALHVLAERTDV